MYQRTVISALVAAIVAGLAPETYAQTPTSVAQAVRPELVTIKSQDEQSGAQALSFNFSGSRPAVKSFQLANPNRLVLDFSGAINKTSNGSLDFQGSGASGIELAGDDSRLRAVVSLRDNTQVAANWNGSTYVLSVSRKANAAPAIPAAVAGPVAPVTASTAVAPAVTPVVTPALVAPTVAPATVTVPSLEAKYDQEILKMDYRKGKTAGSGRLVLDLTNPNTPIDIKTQKNGLVIDFMNTALPTHLAKKFDLSDQMTPASSMEFKQLPDRTRVLLRTQGKWEQSAYQMENRFVFEVKPVFNETVSTQKTEGVQYKGDKLTLNFQNVEVRQILQSLSDFSDLNIITSDTVAGSITLRLKDVPWDQALDLIMQAKNLDQRRKGNVIWIAPQNELREKELSEANFRSEMENKGPMITESFQINYGKAADVGTLLMNQQVRILSKNGSAIPDPRTNTLFVQDTAEKIEAVRGLIKKVDVPVRQVAIDARIIEASEDFGKSLGSKIGFNTQGNGNYNIGNTGVAIGGNANNAAAASGQTSATPSFDGSYFVNLPATGVGGGTPASLAFTLFNSSATRFLNLEISALVSDGKGQILSNPRVVTSDQQEASIEQGTEIPYQQASSSGATAVAFRNASLSLKVKPQITPDGNVLMDLKVNKDSVGTNTSAGPSIDTKNIKTQVLVEDGGTVVIGGIYTQTESASDARVPFLGDLPYIGFLFKTKNSSRSLREMLVFITPKIVADKAISDDLDAATSRDESAIKPLAIEPKLLNAKGQLPRLLLHKGDSPEE